MLFLILNEKVKRRIECKPWFTSWNPSLKAPHKLASYFEQERTICFTAKDRYNQQQLIIAYSMELTCRTKSKWRPKTFIGALESNELYFIQPYYGKVTLLTFEFYSKEEYDEELKIFRSRIQLTNYIEPL